MGVSRTTNTQVEALKGLVQQLADIKSFPDADLPFLLGLETEIISYIRKPMEQMVGQMPGGEQGGGAPPAGPPQAPQAPMPPGMMPGASPGGQLPPGLLAGMGTAPSGPISGVGLGPPPGGRMAPNAPDPDEVRRMANRRPM